MEILLNRDGWTSECMARHFGYWLIEPTWFMEALNAIKAGTFKPMAARRSERSYAVDQSGIALINIIGQMQKGYSKYGGTNTEWKRYQIREAVADEDVKGIMIIIDSPGGTVAGTDELAQDVKEANDIKPVFAHIEDLGASAAYYVASQTRRITATETTEVGSIGVVAIIEDLSERANQMGVKVHVVRSGKYKGVGAPGVPVTEEDLSYFQERIKPFHNQFVSRVMSGRRMRKGDVEELADGRIHIAKKAMELGLIDKVARLDDAMASARKTIRSIQSHKRTKAKINELNNSLIKDKLDAL